MSHVNNVRITASQYGSGTVEIDGTDVAGAVRGIHIVAAVGEMTRVELEIYPRRAAEYDGDALVRLDPAFEQFLTTLGWTPPRP